jgi:hypothetical protein
MTYSPVLLLRVQVVFRLWTSASSFRRVSGLDFDRWAYRFRTVCVSSPDACGMVLMLSRPLQGSGGGSRSMRYRALRDGLVPGAGLGISKLGVWLVGRFEPGLAVPRPRRGRMVCVGRSENRGRHPAEAVFSRQGRVLGPGASSHFPGREARQSETALVVSGAARSAKEAVCRCG